MRARSLPRKLEKSTSGTLSIHLNLVLCGSNRPIGPLERTDLGTSKKLLGSRSRASLTWPTARNILEVQPAATSWSPIRQQRARSRPSLSTRVSTIFQSDSSVQGASKDCSRGSLESWVHDLVRESSRNLLEEFEDPGDLLARPTGKKSTVISEVHFVVVGLDRAELAVP